MLIGIVGKPSVGKSTFFRAATLAEAEVANYPFTTIKPNRAMGFVRIECVDKEFNKQCNPRSGFCENHNRFLPVEVMDVAGLVEGAHEGAGMGNQFLDDLRQADVFLHIIDISGSTNEKGEAVDALSYDPCNDIKFLDKELDLWFYRLVSKGWEKFSRQIRVANMDLKKAVASQLSGLGVNEEVADSSIKEIGKDFSEWNEEDMLKFARILRIKTKPMVIVANKVDVAGAEKNLERLRDKYPNYKIIPCSGEAELALRDAVKNNLIKYLPGDSNFEVVGELNDKQKKGLDYIKQEILNKFGSTGVQDVLNYAIFDLLKYIAIYPGGVSKLEDSEGRCLPDCFLMKDGSTALDFAFKLHTDFGKKFIRAIDVKKKLTKGKDYKLKHRDVIEIISGR